MRLDTSTDPQVGYRPAGQLDVAHALEPYAGAFGRRQAAHLLRRAGFGGTPADIDRLAARGMSGAVTSLLHPSEPDAELTDYPLTDDLYGKQPNAAAKIWWLNRMLLTRRPLLEKMTLFWHGHFATSLTKVSTPLLVQQLALFRAQGLGDFRTLLQSITRDPAMLVWLDNRFNVAKHPNENYAREVMELFTLGLGNYTEDDVRNAARAFTGITLNKTNEVVFNPALHDDGPKTLLGQTGTFGADDAIGIIVSQPVHQRFLCRKMLEFFVYSDPEPELIDALASVYATSGYDVARTVGTILRSNVFYSLRAYRALPKSPLEFVIGVQRYMEFPQIPLDTLSWLERMGQTPLQPPSVKGWDGGPSWINTATLLARFNYVNSVVRANPSAVKATQTGSNAMQTGASGMQLGSNAAQPAATGSPFGELLTQMPKSAALLSSLLEPDAVIAAAGGMHAERVIDTVVAGVLQDDVTQSARAELLGYLEGRGTPEPQPFGHENYSDRVRGALSLVFNLPGNQLN